MPWWTCPISADADTIQKPLFRGVLHQYGACTALGAGAVLAAVAPSARAAWASLGFTLSLAVLFGVSATYHRRHWEPKAKAWMRRADHSTIFVLITGTAVPVTLLGMPEETGIRLLLLVAAVAVVGIVQALFWLTAPRFVPALLAVLCGWMVVPVWSDFSQALTPFQLRWIIAGGGVYTVGAICYATKRPRLSPRYFGYHEVFHLCTIFGALMHFIAIFSMVMD